MDKGIIFDIKRYAIHDGPGVRTTVFFKGCSLRCPWCHNPEGIAPEPELMVSENRCPKDCFLCIPECPESALTKDDGRIVVDTSKCNLCGHCLETCTYQALDIVGREVTVAELLTEVDRDRIFFDESGGGVTVSGGEPLEQLLFLSEFLKGLSAHGFHVTLDTSGCVPFEDLLKISRYVDLFLYDLKMMNSSKHEDVIGVPNELILDNLKKLSGEGMALEIRIPLIAGINDDEDNIREAIEFLLSLKTKPTVSLLPYHRGGCEKFNRLQKEYQLKSFQPPTERQMAKIVRWFSDQGLSVKRGG
jgi:pyruvate formate lyase activating enzyme